MNKNDKIKGITADAVCAGVEQGGEAALSHLADIASLIEDTPLGSAVSAIANGVLGAVAPGVYSGILSYRQKRLERNTKVLLDALIEENTVIESRLNALDADIREKFHGIYLDALLDNIVYENQEGKVQDNIHAFMNIMKIAQPNDDMVLTFFRDLSELNELDIRILRTYSRTSMREAGEYETPAEIMSDTGMDEMQYRFIREKLTRYGLLESKNEEKREKNQKTLQDTVEDIITQMTSKKPKDPKRPRFEKISTADFFSITRLGRQYIQFIDEPIA